MDKVEKGSEVARRARTLLREQKDRIAYSTDRMFAVLMPLQWVLALILAVFVAPLRWEGVVSSVHVHVWAAVLIGGAVTLFPTYMALCETGKPATRYVIACSQMMMSALLIHLTGGRIETHFHVFGSLAFLAFYRDWKLLLPATLIVATDHLVRGMFWPMSVYGVLTASPWRTLEHAAWVVFEDVFLIQSILMAVMEMRSIADNQAQLEDLNRNIETRVLLQTSELRDSEERFRALVSRSPVAMLEIDGQGRCVYANAAFERLAGVEHDRLVGQDWTRAVHPDDRARAQALGNDSAAAGEFSLSTPSGQATRVRARSSSLGGGAGRVIVLDSLAEARQPA